MCLHEWKLLKQRGNHQPLPFVFLVTQEDYKDGDVDRTVITRGFLDDRFGFEYYDSPNRRWIYIKSLELGVDVTDITPQKIADAVMKIVNQISAEYDKVVAS